MTSGARAPDQHPNDDTGRPPRGWYGYRVAGAAALPGWAVEVALTVERPVDLRPEGFASQDDETARPWPPGPVAPGGASGAATRSSSPEPAGDGGQAAHPAVPGPPDPRPVSALVQAVALLRAPGRVDWLAGFAEAAAEVEAAAGIRRTTDGDRSVGALTGTRSPLRMGPPLPGLVPIPPAVAQAQLGAAGARGLPAPLRRWRPAAGGTHLSWREGAGSVLTCDGPCGVSAQAVVALSGAGHADAITPPPGGALVLRAWRTRSTWGAACGLVLGAAQARGLGREAGRVAAGARAAGWDAVVLHGLAALRLARAGDHQQVAPETEARAVSAAQVAALFEACLTAGDLGRPLPAAGPSWALAFTP